MPKKAKRKSTAKKSALRKPKKTAKKKAASKKSTVKKAAKKKTTGGKVIVRKKAPAKKTATTTVKKTVARAKQPVPSKQIAIEPGPPPQNIPPVEEPARHEEAVGTVTHYFSHLGVALIQINNGALKTGDSIHIQGHTTDFNQQVESMELEHQHIDRAVPGQNVGLRVRDHVREHDIVYVIK